MTVELGFFIGGVAWALEHPELGWIILMLYVGYELRGERGQVQKLDRKLTAAVTVIRALARVEDGVDHEAVDEYIASSLGAEPSDFIVVVSEDGEVFHAEGGGEADGVSEEDKDYDAP